ncbi:hypothetical protein NLM24_28510 [Nocardia zapadnayensis]|nr:hypothetical protein [Nocardia zapadnayensis]MCX0274564.1 hypothetical protein [Nocardia zapadnayensis]
MALLGSPQPRSRRRAAPDTDLLVWTPYACTLVVLADFGSVQHGVLTTGPTGRWQLGDGVADLRTGKATPNPILRGRKVRNELAALFRRHGLSEHIDVLVVLIPKTGSRISWTPPPPEDGIETVLVRIGRSAGLAEYFERAAAGPVRWRGEDLTRAFEILGVSRYLPDPDALDEEGFAFAPGGAAGIRAASGASSEAVTWGESGSVAAISAASALPREQGVITGDSVTSPRGASGEQDARSSPPIRDSGAPPAPTAASDPPPNRGGTTPETDKASADSGESPSGDGHRPERDAASSAGMWAADTPARGRIDSDQRVSGPDAGADDFRAGPGRTPVRSVLRRRFGAGGSGPGQRSAESVSPPVPSGGGAVESGAEAAPEPAVARGSAGLPSDRAPDGPARIGSRSLGHGGRDFADSPAAPESDHGHRIGDRVPARIRQGLAGLREVPARARRAAAGPRPPARPPREPWQGRAYGEPARRGKNLRYPAALGLAGVALAAVTATVFAASGFARFDVAEYGALCAGGEGNPAAAPYSAAGPSPVYLGGDLPEYTAFGPSAVWRPIDSAAVQLVACVGQERRGELVHTCQYPPAPGQPVGRTLNLFTAVYRLTVYEARTGSRLAAMEITGDEFGTNPAAAEPDPCRAATGAPEDGLPGRRYSRPSHQQIEQALTPFVAPASQRIRAAR